MEQFLYLVLGALLALLGGIVTQCYQNYLNQKKEDEIYITEAIGFLIDYCRLYESGMH
ncbi:unnamed protein product, partial [marine sediment metagenome]